MKNLIIGITIGIAALFLLIVISIASFRGGIEVTAKDCIISGFFIFNDRIFVCYEKTHPNVGSQYGGKL